MSLKQFVRILSLTILIKYPILEGIHRPIIIFVIILIPHWIIQYMVGTHYTYVCLPWSLLLAFLYAKIDEY